MGDVVPQPRHRRPHPAEVRRRPGQGLHQRQDRHPLQRHVDRGRHPQGVRRRHPLPPAPDFGKGPKIGGGSWQWGISQNCSDPGRRDGLHEVRGAGQVRRERRPRHQQHPGDRRGRRAVKGYEQGGENRIFLDYAKKFAVLRPVTPGYPFIATEFTKTAQDILNGADPKQALDQAVKNIDANQKSNSYFQ